MSPKRKRDVVEQLLIKIGEPITRETYLNAAYLGNRPARLSYEEEQEIPEHLRATEPTHCPEEVALFTAQLCEPVEFLRDVADHICVMPRGIFSEDVVETSLESVAEAYEQVIAAQPDVFHRTFAQRAWQRDGVWVQ